MSVRRRTLIDWFQGRRPLDTADGCIVGIDRMRDGSIRRARRARRFRYEEREEITEMPASFFASMRFGGLRDDSYDEIDRYDP